jgi:hypothetical protein
MPMSLLLLLLLLLLYQSAGSAVAYLLEIRLGVERRQSANAVTVRC